MHRRVAGRAAALCIALCFLVWCQQPAESVQLISTFVNRFLRTSGILTNSTNNQTEWLQNTLTLRCLDTDFSILDLQIGPLFYDIVCEPPVFPYETVLRGFVPFKTRVKFAVIFLTDNVARVNESADSTLTLGQFGTRRRLLAWGWLESIPGVSTVAKAAVCVFNLGYSPACGDGQDSGANANPEHIAQIKAVQNWADTLLGWQETELAATEVQDRINVGVKSMLDNHQKALQVAQGEITTLGTGLRLVTAHVDDLANKTQAAFQQVFDDIASSTVASFSFTEAQVSTLRDDVFLNLKRIANKTNEILTTNTANNRVLNRRIREVTRLTRRLAAATRRSHLMVDARRATTIEVWNKINECITEGGSPFLNPSEAGIEPTVTTAAQRTTFIDKMTLNFVNTTGIGRTAHSYNIDLYCNVKTVLDVEVSNPYWADFLEFIGPGKSTATNGTQLGGCIAGGSPATIVDRCRCWIEIRHRVCPVNTNSFRFDTGITGTSNRQAYQLVSSMCDPTTSPTASDYDGRKIDTLSEWLDFLKRVCPVTLQTESPPHKFQLVSERLGVQLIPPNAATDVCSIDTDVLFESDKYTNTLPFAVYTTWTLSFRALVTDARAFEVLTYGQLPNKLTHELIPFQTLRDGRSYTIYRTSFVCIGNTNIATDQTVPVWRVRPLDVVPKVTITAHSSPRVCNMFGCFPGPVVTSDSTSSASCSVPNSFVLPTASRTLFGEWTPTMSTLLDANEDLGSLNPVSEVREKHYTYLLQDIPTTGFTGPGGAFDITVDDPADVEATLMDAFIARNGFEPNHRAAIVSLDLTEAPVVCILGVCQCVLDPDVDPEWGCSVQDFFGVHPTTNMRQGLLNLVPDAAPWSCDVTLNVVMGEIIQRVFDGCPDFEFIVLSDSTVNLQIKNSLPFPLNNLLIRTSSSSPQCVDLGDLTLTLLAKQTYIRKIPPCGNYTAQVFKLLPNSQYEACQPFPIAVNVDPRAASSVPPSAIVGAFNQTIVRDAAALEFAFISILQGQFLSQIAGFLDPGSGLTLVQQQAAINSSLAAILLQLQTHAAGLDFTTVTAQTVLAPIFQQLNAQDFVFNTFLNAANATFANLTRDVLNHTLILLQLQNDTQASRIATELLRVANANLISALQREIDNKADDCKKTDIGKLPFIGEIWCQIKNTFVNLIIIVLSVIAASIAIPFAIRGAVNAAMEIKAAQNLRSPPPQPQQQQLPAYAQQSQQQAPLAPPRAPPPSSSSQPLSAEQLQALEESDETTAMLSGRAW